MQKKYIIIMVIVLAVIAFLLAWYVVFLFQLARTNQVVAPQKQTTPNTKSTTDVSLGGQIYQQTKNPLQKKLPDTNPVKNANPIQGAYTNPF